MIHRRAYIQALTSSNIEMWFTIEMTTEYVSIVIRIVIGAKTVLLHKMVYKLILVSIKNPHS